MDEHSVQEEHTVRSIQRLLTRLLETRRLALETKTRLDQLQESDAPVHEPEEFKDLQALADYNNLRARYQQELERLTTEHKELHQEYETAEEEVANILPPGKSIVYDYQDEHYEIARDGSGNFKIRTMTPEEYLLRRQRPGPLPS